MTYIANKTINGVDLEIHVSLDGSFYLNDPTNTDSGKALGSGVTLEAAVAKARTTLNKRKVKVEVPFRDRRGRHGTATGFRAGSRKIMVDWGDSKDQVDAFNGRDYLQGDTPDEVIDRLREIQAEKRALDSEGRMIETRYCIRLDLLVQNAIDQALEDSDETR